MIRSLREWGAAFITSIVYFTRIPLPAPTFTDSRLENARLFFPSMGWLVGGFGAVVFVLLNPWLPLPLTVFWMLVAMVLITGAFHEDGFADCCDALGGGFAAEEVLRIMKDSRIGVYGGLGLLLMNLGRYLSLWQLAASRSSATFVSVLLAGHVFSRYAAARIADSSRLVRLENSKSKAVAGRAFPWYKRLLMAGSALLPCLLLGWHLALSMVLMTLLVSELWKRYLQQRIGGYTGDGLGAAQQICELLLWQVALLV